MIKLSILVLIILIGIIQNVNATQFVIKPPFIRFTPTSTTLLTTKPNVGSLSFKTWGCENNNLAIVCPAHSQIIVSRAFYGSLEYVGCPYGGNEANSCSKDATAIVQAACNYKSSCSVPANNIVFGDPCSATAKYLEASYTCVPGRSWGCENNNLTIVCPAQSKIIVSSAFYGSLQQVGCFFGGSEAYSCSKDATAIVQAACNYKSSCTVPANNGVFGDPCAATAKYLEASYSCVPARSWGCENNNLTIVCPAQSQIIVNSAFYGSLEYVGCPYGGSEANSCSKDATSIVQAACNYKPFCSVAANNIVFGDPCAATAKYLEASYSCVPVLKSRDCENNNLTIVCPAQSQIIVGRAFYGSLEYVGCPYGGSEANSCSKDATAIVKAACNYKSSCSVAANNIVFGDPCAATAKYLEASYSCVPVLKSRGCENNNLTIVCPAQSQIIVNSAFYGSLEYVGCPYGGSEANSCSKDATSIVQAACNYKYSCSVPANNIVFGDPCAATAKYLEASYSCVPVLKSRGCENNNLTIVCPAQSQIIVNSAFYGSLEYVGCPYGGSEANSCSKDATAIVQAACNYKSFCSVAANNIVFGDPCATTAKYLEVSYSCLP